VRTVGKCYVIVVTHSDNMTELPELETNALERALEAYNKAIDETVKQCIAATDWDEIQYLDVVIPYDVSKEDVWEMNLYVKRYAGEAPPVEHYGDLFYQPPVVRIDEPTCCLIGVDPETGEKTDG